MRVNLHGTALLADVVCIINCLFALRTREKLALALESLPACKFASLRSLEDFEEVPPAHDTTAAWSKYSRGTRVSFLRGQVHVFTAIAALVAPTSNGRAQTAIPAPMICDNQQICASASGVRCPAIRLLRSILLCFHLRQHRCLSLLASSWPRMTYTALLFSQERDAAGREPRLP